MAGAGIARQPDSGDGDAGDRDHPRPAGGRRRENAGATWLRADDGTLTVGGAAGQVVRLAERLRDRGVGRGDLVVVTARTTPPYVLCWLALASLGAVTVSTDPAGTLDELAGLVRQVLPRVIVTDAALRPLVLEARGQLAIEVLDVDALLGDWTSESPVPAAPLEGSVGPDDLAVLIPTSGTTGRSKLVMQTHRAYAMAGVGFPYWMELTAEDRLHLRVQELDEQTTGCLTGILK